MTVDELGSLLVQLGRLEQLARRSVLVESHGARAYELDQIKTGKGTLSVSRLALSIIGNAQPDRLHEVLRQAHDGLLPRFDIVWSDLQPPLRYSGQGTDEVVRPALRRLVDLAACASGLQAICLTPDAQDLLYVCREQLCDLSVDQSPIVEAWLGKAPGKIVRYALNLAQLDFAFRHAGEPKELNRDHIARARTYVVDYLHPMFCYAIGEASVPVEEKRARVLYRLIRNNKNFKPGERFTIRDVQQAKRAGIRNAQDISGALLTLEQAGVVRVEKVPSSKRQTAKRYAANPRIWMDESAD